MKKFLALLFLSTLTTVAFASPSTPDNSSVVAAKAPVAAESPVVAPEPPEMLRKWASASDCASACKAQGCSGSQYISNGHGDGSCTCSGCAPTQ